MAELSDKDKQYYSSIKRPVNPYAGSGEDGRLSRLQKNIADFIGTESQRKTAHSQKIQPPPVKVFGEEAAKLRRETLKKQQEFFDKYNLRREEHDHLTELIFYGHIKLEFELLGHTFLIRDLDAETRRYVEQVGQKIKTRPAITRLRVKALSKSLAEIDGIPLNSDFLEKMLGQMQLKTFDMIYLMHLVTEEYKLYLYEKLPDFCRTPTSRVRYAIAHDMGVLINDPVMKTLSDEQIYWHYINTVKNDEAVGEVISGRLEYLSWFINPEMAKKVSEKKEMHEESDGNLSQKYAFLNGIMEMIGKDMPETQVEQTMQAVMEKIKERDNVEETDPWEKPDDSAEQEAQAFIKGLSKELDKKEAQMGYMGGSDEWHKT